MARGFVLTLDSAAALFIFFIAVVILTSTSFQPNAARGVYLKALTMDALTVMGKENSKGLELAIDGNSLEVRKILDATPDSACMQVGISDGGGNEIATITKNGCFSSSNEKQSVTIGVVHAGIPYIVTAQSWYKEAGP